jgi:parvulin-like peptidyl-prolyl isomerase
MRGLLKMAGRCGMKWKEKCQMLRPDPSALISLFLFLTFMTGCSPTVIEIKGSKVKKWEYDLEVRERELIHKGKSMPVSEELIRQSALTALINRMILNQESWKEGILITHKEIRDEWEKFKKKFGSADDFRKYMNERNAGEATLRMRFKKVHLARKFYRHFYNGINVTDEEVKKLYQNQNWEDLGPINLKVAVIKADDKDDADRVLEEIKLKKFERVFWDIVKHKREGVEAEEPFWVDPETYDQEMVKEIKKILTGRYEGPMKINNNWYIIQVIKREAKMPGFDRVKEKLRKSLHDRRAKETLDSLIKDRLAASGVKVYFDRL